MQPIGGLLPRTHDTSKDLLGAPLLHLPKLEDLPKDFSLSYPKEWLLTQKEDSCAAHASSLASSFQEGIRLEALYPWIMARTLAGMAPDAWGCSLRDIASAHQKLGAMELAQASIHEGDMNWRNSLVWDTPANKLFASKHKKESYLWVERTNGYSMFDAIKATLYKMQTPIVIGLTWSYGEEATIDIWQEGGFGHAVTVIGWESFPGKDYLRIANSWGLDSGFEGEYRISREVINKEVPKFGGFFFNDLPPEIIREYQDANIKLDDPTFIVLLKLLQASLKSLAEALKRFITPSNPMEQEKTQTPREKLLQAAKDALGKDVTPYDNVPDHVACAESLSTLIKQVYPDFPVLASTATLCEQFKRDSRFKPTLDPLPGNIIISPTKDSSFHGHCGVYIEGGKITSNASSTGLWSQNFTIDSWIKRYREQGHLGIYYFEPISI